MDLKDCGAYRIEHLRTDMANYQCKSAKTHMLRNAIFRMLHWITLIPWRPIVTFILNLVTVLALIDSWTELV